MAKNPASFCEVREIVKILTGPSRYEVCQIRAIPLRSQHKDSIVIHFYGGDFVVNFESRMSCVFVPQYYVKTLKQWNEIAVPIYGESSSRPSFLDLVLLHFMYKYFPARSVDLSRILMSIYNSWSCLGLLRDIYNAKLTSGH